MLHFCNTILLYGGNAKTVERILAEPRWTRHVYSAIWANWYPVRGPIIINSQ